MVFPDPVCPNTAAIGSPSFDDAAVGDRYAGCRSFSVNPSSAPSGSPTVDSDGRPEYATVCEGRSCRCGTARTGEHSQVSANAASCRYGIAFRVTALSLATSATSSNRPFRAASTVASIRVGGPPCA